MINTLIANALPYFPKSVVGMLAKRYIAGPSMEDAFRLTEEIAREGAMGTIDLLGEFNDKPEKAEETVVTYIKVLEEIKKRNLPTNISIKPTAFGALVSMDLCTQNIRRVMSRAAELGIFVRIDMENHPYTDYTLDLYRTLHNEYPGLVGTVIQSYMKRTLDDVSRMSKEFKTNFRLCKGIYKEPEEVAYKDRKKVNDNYLEALDILFTNGSYVGIATHDDYLVEGAKKLIAKHKLQREQYEFQMLLGVRSELRKRILSEGHRLRIYTPFGEDWLPYSVRRLKENPAIVGSAMKGFFTGYK